HDVSVDRNATVGPVCQMRSADNINENTRTNWDTGTDWRDDRAWLGRLSKADSLDKRNSILGQWAHAAGGRLINSGQGDVLLELPVGLAPSLALTELRRVARDLRTPIREFGMQF